MPDVHESVFPLLLLSQQVHTHQRHCLRGREGGRKEGREGGRERGCNYIYLLNILCVQFIKSAIR